MDNSVKIEAFGAKVQITEGGAVFVEINGTTVYFENGSLGRILSAQSDDMEYFDFPDFYQDPECPTNFTVTF